MLIKETARDWWLVVLVGVLVIGANLPEEYTTRFSIDKRVLLAVLVAMVVVSLARYLRMALVVVTSLLAIGANIPSKMAEEFGIQQDILLLTLLVLVTVPVVNKFLKMIPTGDESRYISRSSNGLRMLFSAIGHNKTPLVKNLVDAGVNINGRTVTGMTPLMAAARLGNEKIAECLIVAGARLNDRDNRGRTALLFAETLGYHRTAAFLKGAGCKI